MGSDLAKGGNTPWPHPQAALRITGLTAGASVLAFLVTAAGRVRSDADFVFFNNPTVPRDGAVRHAGDVRRGKSSWRGKAQVGKETIEITLTAEILAVLPAVYSAQSNGTGRSATTRPGRGPGFGCGVQLQELDFK